MNNMIDQLTLQQILEVAPGAAAAVSRSAPGSRPAYSPDPDFRMKQSGTKMHVMSFHPMSTG